MTTFGTQHRYWHMFNAPDILDGVDAFSYYDSSTITCLDEETEVHFYSHDFESGKPLRIKGEWTIKQLPPGFKHNLFQSHGIVASAELAEILQQIAPQEIQRFPIVAEGRKDRFEMINLTHAIDALDMEKASIRFFPKQPDVPMAIFKLALKLGPIAGRQIFRLANHLPTVIVSESFRSELLDKCSISGTRFEEIKIVS